LSFAIDENAVGMAHKVKSKNWRERTGVLATMKERRFYTYSLASERIRACETLARACTCEREKRLTETRMSFFSTKAPDSRKRD